VEFVIHDTGCGINSAELPMLFIPFSQANKSVLREHGGSGLGLSICKKLINLLDGTIWVESAVNVGSSFCVCLPLETATEPLLPSPTNACKDVLSLLRFSPVLHPRHLKRVASTSKHSLQQLPPTPNGLTTNSTVATVNSSPNNKDGAASVKTVLVVDDHLLNRKLIARMVSSGGFVCEQAADGLQAIGLVEQRRQHALPMYSAIIMDLNMPKLNGVESTRALRQDGFTMPIIALSGTATLEERKNAEHAGMSAFVAKPVTREALISVIRALLTDAPG